MFLEILVLLPVVRLTLKILGWRRVQAALTASRRSRLRLLPRRRIPMDRVDRVGHLVTAAARLAGGTCLAQSIVLAHVLERRGIPAQLRIGVRNGESGFQAHCWVEVAGRVVNEGRDVGQRYAAFNRNFALARTDRR